MIHYVWASASIAAAAAVMLLLGVTHLVLTFHGTKLHPRDPSVEAAMRSALPVISQRTTMWRAWIGFNASHAFGAILYGLVYLDLALFHGNLLFQSNVLLGLGLVFLLGWLALAKLYWFGAPFRFIALACVLYVAGLVVGFT